MSVTTPSAARTKAPFHADHVGSFLRPGSLLELREKHSRGEIDDPELRTHEDACIRELVRFQEDIGLWSITDGEFRRKTFHGDFLSALDNVRFEQLFRPGHTEAGGHEAPFVAVVSGKINRPEGGVEIENFRYLRQLTERAAKQTVASPTMLHFRGGRQAIDRQAYPEMEGFFADVARVYSEEVAGLAAAGCRNLQFDDTNLAYLCDETMRGQVVERGEDPDQLPHTYAKLINDSIRTRPTDMAVSIHLCRGNARSKWFAEGGYEPVAEVLFNELDVDGFFLEYDDDRSGGFEPLRFVPENKVVVLGLVSSKWPEMEDKEHVISRIREASTYVPLERLALSPQCGFASTAEGNRINVDVERAKLDLVVDVAREVWG